MDGGQLVGFALCGHGGEGRVSGKKGERGVEETTLFIFTPTVNKNGFVRPLGNFSKRCLLQSIQSRGFLSGNRSDGCKTTEVDYHPNDGRVERREINWTKHGPCAGGGEYKDPVGLVLNSSYLP